MAAFRRYLQRPRLTASILAVVGWLGASLLTMAIDPHPAWAQAVNVSSISVFSRTANGNVPPLRTLVGPATGMSVSQFDFAEPANNELFVTNFGNNSITVYARTASGNAAPIRTISGPATGLISPVGLYVDAANNEIGVESGGNSILIFSRTANGNVAPLRTISGAATLLACAIGLALDSVNNEIFVANNNFSPGCTNRITVYARTASGNVAPLRTISGAATGMTFIQDIHVDPINNEVLLPEVGVDDVRVFSRTASGNVPPLRVLAGSATGLNGAFGLWVDAVNNEIGVTSFFNNSIRVFPRTASGNVAPIRVITGGLTGLSQPTELALDPVNDEVFVLNNLTQAGVPTLSEWGMIALVSLLVVGGLLALRRRAPVLGRLG
jgi:hypothetical protein